MGANASVFEKLIGQKKPSKLFELSLEQLKSHYATFKATCDSFWIDYSQFVVIFNERREIFDLWDINDSCLIDTLEVFSGLALFSDTKFEEKVRFLFEIFDFNELNSLSLSDIEFIISCGLNSAMRICRSHSQPTPNEIHAVVTQNFIEDTRVNLSQLIEFCQNATDFLEFFKFIKKDHPVSDEISKVEAIRLKEKPESAILPFLDEKRNPAKGETGTKTFEHFHGGQIIGARDIKNRNKFIEANAQIFRLEEEKRSRVKTSRLKLSWVYGFRCNDTIKSFVFHAHNVKASEKARLEQKVIYFVSNVVVLYYFKLNKQRHYTEHNNEVSAIAVSRDGKFCATGDKGKYPMINVWKIETLRTLITIYSEYRNDIYLLEFINDDTYLVSVCKRATSPIIVYDIAKGTSIINANFASFVLDVIPVIDMSGQPIFSRQSKIHDGVIIESSFVCYSKTEVCLFGYNNDKNEIWKHSVFGGSPAPTAEITQCCALYIDPANPTGSFYENSTRLLIVIYVSMSNGMLHRVTKSNPITSNSNAWLVETPHDFKRQVEQMVLFRNKYLCVATKNAILHLFDMKEEKIVHELDLTQLTTRLESMNVKNLFVGKGHSVFVSTWEGDFVKISMKQKSLWHESLLVNHPKGKKYQSMAYLPNFLNVMCIVKTSEEDRGNLIYVGGDDCSVFCFSSTSHELIERWSVKHPVTAIAGYANDQGSTIVAVGLSSGQIVFFVDHEEVWTHAGYRTPIHTLKFTKDGSFLFAASNENSFYLFKSKDGLFLESKKPFLRLLSQGDIPISVHFDKHRPVGYIQTHLNKYHEFALDSDILVEVSHLQLDISKLKLQFPPSQHALEKRLMPLIMDKKLGMAFIGSNEGYISVFDSVDGVVGHHESTFYGHSGGLSDLEIDRKRKILYSVGRRDNAVFEWKLVFDHATMTKSDRLNKQNDKFNIASLLPYSKNLEMVCREICADRELQVKTEYLEESLGYFRGYSRDDLRRIIDLQSDAPVIQYPKTLRYPPCSIQLEHVYSLQTFEVRNNFCYFHTMSPPEKVIDKNTSAIMGVRSQLNIESQLNLPSQRFDSPRDFHKAISIREKIVNSNNSSQYKKQNSVMKKTYDSRADFTQTQSNLPGFQSKVDGDIDCKAKNDEKLEPGFDDDDMRMLYWHNGRCQIHASNCMRKIVYFVSRIGIVVDPNQMSKQAFYEGHAAKISVMTIHPKLTMIATGEKAFLPKIHVWNPDTLQTITVCHTFHRQGIIALKFSLEKYFIISVSVDNSTSMQVSDWRSGKIVAFRNAFVFKIINVQFDPNDECSFATVTLTHLDTWQVLGNSIIHVHSVQIPVIGPLEFVTDLCYINYFICDRSEKSILVATSDGQMGLVTGGLYFNPPFEKLNREISVIKVIVLNNSPLIFIAAFDSLHIYDLSFAQLFSSSIEDETSGVDSSQIQSMDIYIGKDVAFCLLGLTQGFLVEMALAIADAADGVKVSRKSLKVLSKGHTPFPLKSSDIGNQVEMVDKQVTFCIPRGCQYMLSAGADNMIYFWDTSEQVCRSQVRLDEQPTCMKFTPNMKYLVVGFLKGSLKFYPMPSGDSLKSLFESEKKEFKPEIEIASQVQTSETAVLNIEFSKDSNFIAVSYANPNANSKPNTTSSNLVGAESSNIHIFTSKDTSKSENKSSSITNSYNYYGELKISSSKKVSSSSGDNTDPFSTSCYFMLFSDDCNYLVAYFQNVHTSLHSRQVSDTSGRYIVFSLATKSEKSLSSITRPIKMNTLYFPSHLNGQRILGSIKSSPDYSEANMQAKAFENLNNDKIIVSCTSALEKVAALGCMTGEIYLIKKVMVNMLKDESTNNVDHLYQAKRYPAHTSFVNQIEFSRSENNSHHLFTTGISDECVFQWKVFQIDAKVELDHLDGIELQDRYYIYEVENNAAFKNFTMRICPNRKRISEVLLQKDTTVFPEFRLRLANIIGRKAFTRRSNILMISNGQLIYSSGTALILLEYKRIDAKATRLHDAKHSSDSNAVAKPQRTEASAINQSNEVRLSNQIVSHNDKQFFKSEGTDTNTFHQNADGENTNMPLGRQTQGRSINVRSVNTSCESRPEVSDCAIVNKQSILLPNINYQIKATAEIMCFELAKDNKTLCVATRDEYSSVLVWEICSQSFKGSLVLEQCISPVIIRCSDDSKFLVCCGITKDYSISLYYCNITTFEILGMLNLKYSDAKKIVDLSFLPFKNDEFMTVGFIHCAKWRYRAGILEFKEVKLELAEKKLASDYHHETKQEDAHSLFLVLKFIDPAKFILTDATGHIYMCDNDKIHDKYQCLNDAPVTTIALLNDMYDTFAAGGFSTEISFFRVCAKNPLKMHIKPLVRVFIKISLNREPTKEEESHQRHEMQVQSLLFPDEESIICGMRDGSIHEIKLNFNHKSPTNCTCTDNLKIIDPSSTTASIQNDNPVNEIIRFFDHHEPKVADFSADSTKVFCISSKGLLVVYNLITFTSFFTYDFKDHVQNMYLNKTTLFLVFAKRVLFLQLSVIEQSMKFDVADGKNERPSVKLSDLGRVLEFEETIEDSCISRTKRFLALSLVKSADSAKESRTILIYKITSDYEINKNASKNHTGDINDRGVVQNSLQLLHPLSIESYSLMDFSTDESYLIYVGKSGKRFVHYFNETKIAFMGDNFNTKIEWQGVGMFASDTFHALETHFPPDNPLKSIVRLNDRAILTSDEIGTVW